MLSGAAFQQALATLSEIGLGWKCLSVSQALVHVMTQKSFVGFGSESPSQKFTILSKIF